MTNNLKKIVLLLLFVSIILIVIILLLRSYLKYGTITTPRITAPYEAGINYDYSNEDFEECYENSDNIYDIGICYYSRNFEIEEKSKSINYVGEITVTLKLDGENITEYSISSSEDKMELWSEIGDSVSTTISFSYPDNKIINSDTKLTEFKRVDSSIFSAYKNKYSGENSIKVYESKIIIPINAKYADLVLEKAVFSENNSEEILQVLEEIKPYI